MLRWLRSLGGIFRFHMTALLYSFRWSALLLLVLLSGLARAQTPSFDLAVTLGRATTTSGSVMVHDMVVDAAGNSYVAGYFNGSVAFGATVLTSRGDNDLFVAKLDPAGTCLWVQQGGGAAPDAVRRLALDGNGNLYLAGHISGYTATVGGVTFTPAEGGIDLLVGKISTSGQWQWVVSVGGVSTDAAMDMVLSRSGTLYVAGLAGAVTFGSTTLPLPAAGFVATISPAGTWLSAQRTPADILRIALDGADNLYMAGEYYGTTTFGSTTLPLAPSTSSDVFVAKRSAAGQWLWAVNASGTEREALESLAVDANGDAYVAGSFAGVVTFGSTQIANAALANSSNAYVAKVGASGQWLWAVRGGSSTNPTRGDAVRRIVLDAAGNPYVVGWFGTPATFGSTVLNGSNGDLLIARLTPAGQWQWAMAAGSGGSAGSLKGGTALALQQNTLYVAGYMTGAQAGFGSLTVTGSPVGTSGFWARLNAGALASHAARPSAGFYASPNPAHGPVRLSGTRAGEPVQVLDAQGRVVARPQVAPDGTLPLPAAPGLYLLRSGAHVCRVVVE